MTTIRQLFGTVLVVSVFWLFFTLMIMTYHEDLIRSDHVYEYEPMSDEDGDKIKGHQKSDEHAGFHQDMNNAQEKSLRENEPQNKEFDHVSNIPAYKNNQQRVNTIHNHEHIESKYDKSETSNEINVDSVIESININHVQKQKDSAGAGDIQNQHDGPVENEAVQNNVKKGINDIQSVNNALPAGQETNQENNNDPADANHPMEENNNVHPAAAADEVQNAPPAGHEADQENINAPADVNHPIERNNNAHPAAAAEEVQNAPSAGHEANQENINAPADVNHPVERNNDAHPAAAAEEVQNAPPAGHEANQENINAPADINHPVERNNDANPAAVAEEAPHAPSAGKEPDQKNDTEHNKVLQENSDSQNKIQQDAVAPSGNEGVQNNQGAPINPNDMAKIQKQMQEAMKQNIPEGMGDIQMMVPNAEELQKALAGGQQPGLQVMPVQQNQDGGNPLEALQKQMGALGAGNEEGAENVVIPLDSLGGLENAMGNMKDMGAARNAGNPFGNMNAFGGLGNPMLGNNGVGVVNPLAALLGAANNPAMQFNMQPDDEAPPYKWEVDLDTIVKRAPRNAPGEMGEPVEIVIDSLAEEERKKYDEGEKQHAFNVYASDMISLRRRLKDPRDMACKAAQYTRQMPDTSVIICFHNEAWSVLLRTVFSILDRSPPHLIREIILVDDKSVLKELGKPLERYMAQLKKVKIVRTKKREGLIRARLLGVSVAKGAVLTFMDSHCEVHPGWLEPLLDRIAEDPTRVVCPVINQLNHATLRQDITPAVDIGIFKLDKLEFTWGKMFSREIARRTSDTEPFRTPTMAGGLFSVTRDYFLRMGKYDAGMDIWGAENLEMSFRVWMCGGSIEIHPCSHVGHIFRSRSPYDWGGKTIGEILRKNTVRLAEVWADEYKHYYYYYIGYNLGDYGDVSERKALRQKLHCTSFDTYVRNVYPELFPLPPKHPYAGEIKNEGKNLCIDSMGEKLRLMIAAPCHSMGGNQEVSSDTLLYQFFGLSENGEIDRDGSCVTKKGEYVAFTTCNGQTLWDYSQDRHLILRGTNDCLVLGDEKYVKIAPCANNKNQQWIMTKRDV